MNKKEKMQEFRALSEELLLNELARLKKASLFLQCRLANGQVEKLSEISFLKKDVARLMTAWSEKKNAHRKLRNRGRVGKNRRK